MTIYRSAAGAREIADRYEALLARWPVPHEIRRIATRHGETAVTVCGPAEAPPVMLFHGAASNSAFWGGDIAVWSQHFRIYAVDTIGEPGLSSPERPALASGAYALWMEDVMDGLGLAHAAIVGLSLGGWLALEFATRHPDRADALVLLCPGGIGRQRWDFFVKALPLIAMGPWGEKPLRALVFGPVEKPITDPDVLNLLSSIFRHFQPRMEQLPVFPDEALRRLAMPVLTILGGQDALLDSAHTRERLETCVPHAEVIFLEEAGHAVIHQTQPILRFLQRCLQGTPVAS